MGKRKKHHENNIWRVIKLFIQTKRFLINKESIFLMDDKTFYITLSTGTVLKENEISEKEYFEIKKKVQE